MQRDRLVLVLVVPHYRGGQDVKWSPQKHVVRSLAHYMDLQEESHVADDKGDIASETQRAVDLAIRALHVQNNAWVV